MSNVWRRLNKIVVIAVIALVIAFAGNAFASATNDSTIPGLQTFEIPAATNEFYVNDFAGIFSSEQKQEMMDVAVNLAENERYGYQVVVTTISTTGGVPMENYSIKMAEQYKIGKDGHGVLILLATEDREIRVETGVNMESILTDGEVGLLIEKKAIPALKKNQFAEGLVNLQQAIIAEILLKVPSENPVQEDTILSTPALIPVLEAVETDDSLQEVPSRSVVSNDNQVSENNLETTILKVMIAILLIVIVLLWYFLRKKIKRVDKLQQGFIEKDRRFSDTRSRLRSSETRCQELNEHTEECLRTIAQLQERIQRETDYAQKEQARLKNENQILRSKNKSLEEELAKTQEAREKLSSALKLLTERFARARKLHPNLNTEIEAMIAKEEEEKNRQAAEKFDEKAEKLLAKPNSSSLIEAIELLLHKFDSLPSAQKDFSKTNRSKIEEKQKSCEVIRYRELAEELGKKTRKILEKQRPFSDDILSSAKRLLSEYSSLGQAAKYVDFDLKKQLEEAYLQDYELQQRRLAEERRQREEEEEAERKRRQREAEEEEEEAERKRRQREAEEEEEAERKRRQREAEEEEEAERKRRQREAEEEEAERKRRQREEEDRRRRAASTSFRPSHSSFGSSSHHSGMGGGFRGGGAGGKF